MASILIVEGSPSVARLFATVLQRSDWTIETTSDMTEAVAAVSSNRDFAAILVSYKISGGDGLELVKLIRSKPERIDTPVLMVTGTPGVEYDAIAAGANEVLRKPVDMQALVAAVTRHINPAEADGAC